MAITQKFNYRPTLDWLLTSIRVNNGAGSSANFYLFKGWSAPYPETTGYIIGTLLDYHDLLSERELMEAAMSCSKWLLKIQNEDGSFPAGIGGKGNPIVFDTAMILFGLTNIYRKTGDQAFMNAIQKSVSWVLDQLNSEKRWNKFAWVPGYEPAYYTMVIWAMLYANKTAKYPGLEREMTLALDNYEYLINGNSSVRNWAFHPGKQAFTHTIAYTWQGFLESAILLNDKKTTEKCIQAGHQLVDLYRENGVFAGSYDENWKGNYSFKCLTGQAQLSLFLWRLSGLTQETAFQQLALELVADLEKYPSILPFPGVKGGITGSYPVWGSYERFCFPNWAAKFYLDAAILKLKSEMTAS